ncbi:MAG: hypothetical protein A3C30_04305 [Candidatus Levybacteria bacterium RIFCSPHIGHO2_02_FULL_40_18]|nr:MAG: hypothetical protein A2869_01635 [Candidatus Levybacteria bacterium RIFCSPHIGHO2_01_FULL_40_58]OGH26304.1 MAG: hypothetical protein A3C30_04305 [Candidatus Levybacteria bacterium RIFCSPHIGHO2_02_FULL_40_18]OGH31263.1 MAG: hypothetical protein A3E43_02560 [Candidatus Levybacteria bacterium RIFCSPHIGHO2_12_FULL_40_31]OGH40333.1 MAG: hypothetical protein A2894_05270 [Candidatus Levybacteria bacterium RIFCSPLOWO2_01_FULL_40_64]OGH49239.1 MAG: hypothetical protein A3I54_01170 [Candidatus Lev
MIYPAPFLSKLELCSPKPKNGAGFTLVELLLYMGILSLFLLVQTQIFTSVLGVRLESEANSQVSQDSRFIMARLIYDINRAENIAVPATPSAVTDSLELIIDGTSNIYSLSAGNLLITNSQGSDNLNSFGTRISNLSFKKLGNVGGKNTVTISLTLTSVTQREAGPETRTVQTTSGLR